MESYNEHDYETLPIVLCKDEILAGLNQSQIVLCFGETGCGKTTQLPQIVADSANIFGRKVCIVQSSAFSTLNAAQVVSYERRGTVGTEVGCKSGCNDKVSSKSRIIYMTEEIFLREYVADRLLASYAAVFVEDVHERTVQSEIICGILKSLVMQRVDLKVVLTSVPHNAEALQAYFPGSATIQVPESVFPVDIFHAKAKKLKIAPEKNSYVQGALNVIMKVHQKNEDGHILVFLPSLNDIAVLQDQLALALRDLRAPNRELVVLPFHEGLTPSQFQKIHRASRGNEESPPAQHGQPAAEAERVLRRKCVLVAEMPESSVHVPHVRFVVDSGYTKEVVYDAKLGCETDVVVPISKNVALLRAGRAGCLSAGQCYRLYSIETFESLPEDSAPAIQSTSLQSAVLYLKQLEVPDIRRVDFLHVPSQKHLLQAVTSLHQLGALDAAGYVTPLGRQLAAFPMLQPAVARLLVAAASSECDCLEEATTIAAMLSVGHVWAVPDARSAKDHAAFHTARSALSHPFGDLHTYLYVYNTFIGGGRKEEWCEKNYLRYWALIKAEKIRNRIAEVAGTVFSKRRAVPGTEEKSPEVRISSAITAGLFAHAAMYSSERKTYAFTALHSDSSERSATHAVAPHVSSVLSGGNSTYAAAVFLTLTSVQDNLYMHHVAKADASLLSQLRDAYTPLDPASLCTFNPSKRSTHTDHDPPLKKGIPTGTKSPFPTASAEELRVDAEWELTENVSGKAPLQRNGSIPLPPEEELPSPTKNAPEVTAVPAVQFKKTDMVEVTASDGSGTGQVAVVVAVSADGASYDVVYADRSKEGGVSAHRLRAATAEQKAETKSMKAGKKGSSPTRAAADGSAAAADANTATTPAEPKASRPNTASAEGALTKQKSSRSKKGDHMAGVVVGEIVEARHHQRWIPVRIESRNGDGSFDVTPLVGKSQKLHHNIPANHLRPKEVTEPDQAANATASPAVGVTKVVTADTDAPGSRQLSKDSSANWSFNGLTRAPSSSVGASFDGELESAGLVVGAKVLANFRGRGKWYPGHISGESRDGTFVVDYDDGEKEEGALVKNIKLLSREAPVAVLSTAAASDAGASAASVLPEKVDAGAASSSAALQEGDKVEGNFRGKGKWFPATIDRIRPDGTIDLDYEDGEHERKMDPAHVRRPQPKAPEPSAPVETDGPLREGEKVQGNYRGKGKWYPATVDRVRADGTVDLDYDDGEHEVRVSAANVHRPGVEEVPTPAEPTPAPLQEGDKVEGNYRGKGKWFPGKIDRIRADGSYDIDYDDGEHEVRVSAENVRRPGAAHATVAPAHVKGEPGAEAAAAGSPFREGDKVEGNYHAKGRWYPATVKAVSSKGKLNLHYDDGTKEHHVEPVRVRHLQTTPSAPDASAQTAEVVKSAGFAVGQKILGDYRGKNRWYPAKVASVNNDGTYNIDYDDGEKESNLRPERLRAVEESTVQHTFQLGDKVSVMYANTTRVFPAQITKAHADGTFDVRYDDGETERSVPPRKITPRVLTPLKAPAPAPAADTTAETALESLAEGQKVEGNYRGKGKWYPARIARVNLDGTYNLDYDDGEKETRVAADNVRATGGNAKTCAPDAIHLQEGDKVEGNYRGKGKWYPARVKTVHRDGTYDIDYDDGEKERDVSPSLVRAAGQAAGARGSPAAVTESLKEGDKVEGNYRGKGKWYPARIARVNLDGTYNLDYDDGEKETRVTADLVRAVGGAARRSARSLSPVHTPLREGDRVEGNYRGKGKWYPARVRTVHRDGTFDIDYDDGEKERDVSPSCVRGVGQKALTSRANPASAAADLQEGDKVEGNYRGKGRWYPARVRAVNSDGTYDIDYDDGEKEREVDASNVRSVGHKAAPRDLEADQDAPVLKEGDKVEGNYRGKGRWFPARINRVNGDGTYNLDYDDGEKETRLVPEMVRVVGGGVAKSPVQETRLQEGDKVEGNYRGKGGWYAGRISRVNADGTFNVDYDDGEKETRLEADLVRAVGNGVAKSPVRAARLQEGDKVEGNYRGKGKWYPARIGRVNLDGTYNLDYDDGEKETRVTHDHVRATGAPVAAVPPNTSVPSLRKGDKVEGNYRGKGRWYPARVKHVHDDGTVDIDYDDGEIERGVEASNVRAVGQSHAGDASRSAPEAAAYSHPLLAEGDRVEGNYRGKGRWYPGRIARVNHDGSYNIDYDDGEREGRVSHELVRSVAQKHQMTAETAVAAQAEVVIFVEGDKVDGNYRGKGKWYPATVDRVRQDGSLDLDYDDGEKEARVVSTQVRRPKPAAPLETTPVPSDAVPAAAEASPAAPLLEGDRVEGDYRGEGAWLPATIDRIRPDGTFDLDYDNGAREVRVAQALVRRPLPPTAAPTAPAVVSEPETPKPIQEGDKVEGNYRGKGKWYPATVDKVRADGSFDLDYKDDGEREARVDSTNVRHRGASTSAHAPAATPATAPAATPASTAAANPVPAMSFEAMRRAPTVAPPPVGARVEANYRNRGKWYPGYVARVRDDFTVDIKYDDGGFETRLNLELVRILAEPAVAESSGAQPHAPAPSSLASSARRPEQPGASFKSPLKFGRSYRAEQRSAEKAAAEPIVAAPATPAAAVAAPVEAPAVAAKAAAPSRVNIKVAVKDTQANYRNKGIWLAITHVTERENGVFDVVYEDGDVEKGLIPDRIFPPPTLSEAVLVEEPPFTWGQRVEVNYHNKGVWLSAAVANVHPNGTVDVEYADGETETNIAPRLIRALADADVPSIQTALSPVAPGGARRPQRPTPNRAQAKTGTSTDSGSTAATPRKQVRYGNDVKGGSEAEDGAGTPAVTIATTTTDAELASMMDLQFFNDSNTATSVVPHSPAATASDAKASPGGSVGSIRWDESVDFDLSDDEVSPSKGMSPKQLRNAHK